MSSTQMIHPGEPLAVRSGKRAKGGERGSYRGLYINLIIVRTGYEGVEKIPKKAFDTSYYGRLGELVDTGYRC